MWCPAKESPSWSVSSSGDAAPPGVIFRDASGTVTRTEPAALIRDLDSVPWPARDSIDIGKYLSAWRSRHGTGSVSLITARGCPFECRWCSHATFGRTHRRRSVHAVADEAEWILEHYHPEMLWYADDVFTIRPEWTVAYAAEMKRRGIGVPFECITRADRLDARTADALAESGCFRLWIGSESGSQRILDSMRRGVRVEQVREAVRSGSDPRDQGWDVPNVGLRRRRTRRHRSHRRTCEVVPSGYFSDHGFLSDQGHRVLYRRCGQAGASGGNGATPPDRDVKIRGRHSRRFYQHADDLLRHSVDQAPDPRRIAASRAGLQETFAEVEA